MNRITQAIALLACATTSCFSQTRAGSSISATLEGPLDGAVVFSLVSQSIAIILTDAGLQGSAVAVISVPGEGTGFATNCHILANAKSFTVATKSERAEGLFYGGNAKNDACIVYAKVKAHVPEKFNVLDLLPGEKVYAVGAPRGLELSITEGIFSARRGDFLFEPPVLLQISAPISPGSSGGGLFDARGRLIGVTTFALKDSQGLNFAIAINMWNTLYSKPPIETLEELNRALRALAIETRRK